jgi:hypothetical protein
MPVNESRKSPRILSSDRSFFWRLAEHLSDDYFDFQQEGAGALLLIGIHLSDPLPWVCARHPVLFDGPVGLIDGESKRILGKRFGSIATAPGDGDHENKDHAGIAAPLHVRHVDPIALAVKKVLGMGDLFDPQAAVGPSLPKTPGKIRPRAIGAKLHVMFDDHDLTLYGRNYSEISQCLHAELALIFVLSAILEKTVKKSDRLDFFHLESQLKPCRMCAAFLHKVRTKCDDFRVDYERDDPGPLARNTMLDQFGYEHGLRRDR